jgi:hypothetical protein
MPQSGAPGSFAAIRASGRELPERPSAADIALAGIATHKVTRLIAKDRVTSFIRAPFTRYQEPAGHGELEEAARGTGAADRPAARARPGRPPLRAGAR